MAIPHASSPVDLLLQAIRSLPVEQQDVVLNWLVQRVGQAPLQPALLALRPRTGVGAARDREQHLLTLLAQGTSIDAAAAALLISPAAARSQLRSIVLRTITEAEDAPPLAPVLGGGDVTTFPVRLPRADYDALKSWCEQHKFTMAVVVRGLVEQFLRRQAPPA